MEEIEKTENDEKQSGIKSDKRQTEFLVGISLVVLSIIFFYFAFSQPRIAVPEENISYNASSQGVVNEENNAKTVSFVNENDISSQTLLVNLNTCTKEELMKINGIGESKAESIIAYRDVIGEYTSTEQLMDIFGIGESVYEKIAPYVTV